MVHYKVLKQCLHKELYKTQGNNRTYIWVWTPNEKIISLYGQNLSDQIGFIPNKKGKHWSKLHIMKFLAWHVSNPPQL